MLRKFKTIFWNRFKSNTFNHFVAKKLKKPFKILLLTV